MTDSLWYFGIFTLTILGTILLAFSVNRLFLRFFRRSSAILKNDPTNYLFLRHAVVALIYLVGFGTTVYLLPNLRALASSLLAGAGILAVAVGFASQHALGNIISGIFIIINSDFAKDKICKWIDLRISYDSDIDRAKAIIQQHVQTHPLHIDPRTPEEVEGANRRSWSVYYYWMSTRSIYALGPGPKMRVMALSWPVTSTSRSKKSLTAKALPSRFRIERWFTKHRPPMLPSKLLSFQSGR